MLKLGKIAVIVLNWNNAPDTLECLESIYQSADLNYSIYVVDNGSKDNSLSVLQKTYPDANYLPLDKNYGFVGGNNIAFRRAIADGAEYLFLLNSDATINKETLSILRKSAERFPNACALGPRVYYYDLPMTLWYSGVIWAPEKAGFYHLDWGVDENLAPRRPIAKTDYVNGCAFFVRVSALKSVGFMDERYFLNWEEIDWCFRMRKKGFDCLVVPEAKAWHKISRSFVGGRKGAMWNYYFYRNRLLWMQAHLPLWESLKIVKRVLWPDFLELWKDRKNEVSRAGLKGIRDYFLRRFGAGSFV